MFYRVKDKDAFELIHYLSGYIVCYTGLKMHPI